MANSTPLSEQQRKDVCKLFTYKGAIQAVKHHLNGGLAAPMVGGQYVINLSKRAITIVTADNRSFSVRPITDNARRILLYQLYEELGAIDELEQEILKIETPNNRQTLRDLGMREHLTVRPIRVAKEMRDAYTIGYPFGFAKSEGIEFGETLMAHDYQSIMGLINPEEESSGNPNTKLPYDILTGTSPSKLAGNDGDYLLRKMQKYLNRYESITHRYDTGMNSITNTIRTARDMVLVLSPFGEEDQRSDSNHIIAQSLPYNEKDKTFFNFNPPWVDGEKGDKGYYFERLLDAEFTIYRDGQYYPQFALTIGYNDVINKFQHYRVNIPDNPLYLPQANIRVEIPRLPTGYNSTIVFIRMAGIIIRHNVGPSDTNYFQGELCHIYVTDPYGIEREVASINVESMFTDTIRVNDINRNYQISFHPDLASARSAPDPVEAENQKLLLEQQVDKEVTAIKKEMTQQLDEAKALGQKYKAENIKLTKEQEQASHEANKQGFFESLFTNTFLSPQSARFLASLIIPVATAVVAVLVKNGNNDGK